MRLDEALAGKEIPNEIRENLSIVEVPYFSFDREVRTGQLVVHMKIADEAQQIFKKLCEIRFQIQQIVPIVFYNWDDDASMSANNTSAFNYRLITGTDRLSNHSFGLAIDINPVQNPYTERGGKVVPPGAVYDLNQTGTITSEIANIFKSYGWEWGGDWKERKDWQHFEKPK